MKHARTTAIATVGLLTLVVVYAFRSRSPGHPAPTPIQRIAELPPVDMRTDLDPASIGVAATADRAAIAAARRMEELSGISPESRAQLEQELKERIVLLLDPSIDAWRAQAARHGATLPNDPQDQASRDAWDLAANGFRQAPIASEHIAVRLRAPDKALPGLSPGSWLVRPATDAAGAGARFPLPPANDPTVQAVEVLIPLRARATGSSVNDMPATVVLRFFRTRSRPWTPYDMIVFFDATTMGRTFTFPVF